MTTPDRPAGPTLDSEVVDRYLARIGHAPVDEPTTAALASLQDAHVRTVPFENLDIHLGWPLSLDLADLADKVIDRRRGGFCYELNGLFCALLASLGFDAWLVEARVRNADGSLGPRFDHARILVAASDGPWLVDVGTGVSPRGPIRLDDAAQRVGHARFRVREVDGRYDSDVDADGGWVQGWSFEPTARALDEFRPRCRYHERSPDSHFTHKPICTLVTDEGHVTLADRELITTDGHGRHEAPVDDPLAVLAERFGIAVPRWPGS